MGTILGREPALILGLVGAGIALAVGFGLNWTGQQVALSMAFTAAVLGVIVRQVVTPVIAPVLPRGTTVRVQDTGAAVTV